MPFTFKLSKRLALAKVPVATALAAAIGACEPSVPVTGPSQPSSVAQVVTSPDTTTIDPLQTRQFVAYGRTQAGDSVPVAVRWSASGGTIRTNGLYTADTTAGVYVVTATVPSAAGSSPVSGTSRIRNRGGLAQVVVTPTTAVLLVGGTAQFGAYGRTRYGDSVAVSVTWSSGNAAVATVNSSGLATGKAAGSTVITATTSGGISGTAGVTGTTVPVASVTVTPATVSVTVGQTVQLTATVRDAAGNVLTGRTVAWASSALGVATTSSSGLVTGRAVGVATITVTSEGQSGTAAVSVLASLYPPYPLGLGSNYYVAPSGSDANPCTAVAPCYSMARVSQLLQPGGNAHFAPGAYTWGTQNVAASGTASARITYISDVRWSATITGTGTCEILRNTGDYVDIVGFDMTGPCSTGLMQDGNYGRIIGNRVHDLPGTGGYAGILVDCCAYHLTGNQVLSNVVDNIGPLGGSNLIHGIYVAGPNSVIENNLVTRAAAACIETYHGATHMIIANNTVANCGHYGIQVSADATITTNDYTTVDNNIVVNVAGPGIQEWPATGSYNVYHNNLVYNNAGGDFALRTGTASGTITLTSAQFSALFVNYTGDLRGDYHLQSGAAAIAAGSIACATGVSLCVPTIDLDGVLRPPSTLYDIGAYEH